MREKNPLTITSFIATLNLICSTLSRFGNPNFGNHKEIGETNGKGDLCYKIKVIQADSHNKSQISQIYFYKEIYMFQTDLLSTTRSLNTVYTAIGICIACYVDCLLAS